MRGQKRNLNIDLIRVAACFLVISVHFFPNTGFYGQTLEGAEMFLLTFIRNFSMICVPLFMVLTGYLSRHFAYDKKHILRFAHVLIVYLLSTLVCKLFRTFFLGYDFSIKNVIYGLIDFSGAPYAWYVEMYLGMLVMIPLLNAGWHELSAAAKRTALMGFVFLSSAHTILPDRSLFDYWTALYPIAYYFVGAYLAEHAFSVRRRVLLPLLIGSGLLLALASFVRDGGSTFRALPFVGHSSVYVLAVTVLFFLLVLRLDLTALPRWLGCLIRAAGKATLPAYLVSYCFDCMIYEPLCIRVPLAADQLPYYFLLVPANFIGSLLIGYVITLMSDAFMRPVRMLTDRIRLTKEI